MADPPYTEHAVGALARAVEVERDFAGWLAGVLADVAAAKGSSAALTAGRPGSWEAALIRQLLAGTVGEHDEYLHPELPVVAAKRELVAGSGRVWVIDCPYCGREHTHGAKRGHRMTHCGGSVSGYIVSGPERG